MRAIDHGSPSAIGAPRIVALLLCSALCACGQRGPLYYPKLPPLPSAPASAAAQPQNAPVVAIPSNLPAPQTRLLDGTPTTILVAPEISLPEAGDSTMPMPTQAVPASTPPAGTATPTTNGPSSASAPPSGTTPAAAVPSAAAQ